MTDRTLVDLRNAIYDRIVAIDGLAYATTRKVPLPTLQSAQLPALSVFILGGDAIPDGDPNAGNVRLVEDNTIAISIVRGMDDTESLEVAIEDELQTIKDALFTDPTFVQFYDQFFEGLLRTRRRWLFPQGGETYNIELRYEMTFRRREYFDVVVNDAYVKTVLTTRPLGKDDKTPAITTEIDLAQ